MKDGRVGWRDALRWRNPTRKKVIHSHTSSRFVKVPYYRIRIAQDGEASFVLNSTVGSSFIIFSWPENNAETPK